MTEVRRRWKRDGPGPAGGAVRRATRARRSVAPTAVCAPGGAPGLIGNSTSPAVTTRSKVTRENQRSRGWTDLDPGLRVPAKLYELRQTSFKVMGPISVNRSPTTPQAGMA